MPIYEYTCEDCGEEFETLVRSMTDASKQRCPKCGRSRCARRMSVFAAQGTRSKASSSGGGCSGCAATNCSTCGH
jgi:putative FmdB family regulatory protein